MVKYTNTKGKQYFLHKKLVMLRSKRGQTIYFFSTHFPNSASDLDKIPEGFIVKENERSNMPFLKRVV